MRADSDVVRSLEDHVLRHLPLNRQCPVITFGQANGLTALPPWDARRHAGPDTETGIDARRLRDDILSVANEPVVQFEDRGDAVVIRGSAEDDNRPVEMSAASRRADDAEAARRASANHSFVIERISKAKARADTTVPAWHQRA